MAESRGPELAAAIITFLVLTWATTALRIWVRLCMIKNFALDDWLTLLAVALFTFYSGLVLDGVHWGQGQHMANLDMEHQINSMKSWWACELIYIANTTILRGAVGAFLLRIAVKPLHRRIIYFLLAVNVICNIGFFFQSVFQCAPINFFYMRFDGREMGACNSGFITRATYGQSVLSAIIDWTFGLLPLFIVWNLNMNQRKKTGLAVVLGLGSIASAATIVRMPFLYTLTHSHDFLWDTTNVAICSSIEPGLGITALNLATLRPLFRKYIFRSAGSASYDRRPSDAFRMRSGKDLRSIGSAGTREKAAGYVRHDSPMSVDEEAQQLRGLGRHMGNVTRIEAGRIPRQPSPARLKDHLKSVVSSRNRSPVRSEDDFHITKTTEVVTYSREDMSEDE